MPRLIINADDFGLTAGVNRAILECHQAGTVTSCTLMANSAEFQHAVDLAKANPKLGIGCHVLLVDGVPLTETPSLLAPARKRFRSGITEFAHRALRGRLNPDEIYREALAQFQKIAAAGITPTHFDSHKHTHMFPQALAPILRAAKECGVRALRNPYAPVKALAFAHLLRRPRLWVRYSEVRALRRFAAQFRREVEAAGMRSTDGTFGILVTGEVDQTLFNAIIGSIPEGTWEFVCHPGYSDSDLDKINTRLHGAREAERTVLTSAESLDALRRRGVELISYAEL